MFALIDSGGDVANGFENPKIALTVGVSAIYEYAVFVTGLSQPTFTGADNVRTE